MLSAEDDLLGNDLFLIDEMEEDLINSLKGCYNRMYFFENEREIVDFKLLEKFKKRKNELMELKIELLDKDIEYQKRNIKSLSAEFKIASEMEDTRYKIDYENFKASE